VRVVLSAPALPLGDEPPPPGPYVLAVGDLRPKKNLARLVEAWRTLRADGLPHRLVLAGADFGQGPGLRELAGAEPLELEGFVSDLRVDALLRGADLLVNPSLYEGFGLVVVEAMARGCPLALARRGALPETGADGAVYFDPLDLGSIAHAMRSVLADAMLRERLVRRARARVDVLSWERTAAETEAVYRERL
jgi:glycosyltransferase involved in cell wall biosynthesis